MTTKQEKYDLLFEHYENHYSDNPEISILLFEILQEMKNITKAIKENK